MANLQESIDNSNILTFDQLWAILQETGKRLDNIAKGQEEFAAQVKENEKASKEAHERLSKAQAETDKMQKENAKQIAKLGDRFGEMVEYMVLPNLEAKFKELNYNFLKAYHRADIKDKDKKVVAEADITLEAEDTVMIVEVKAKPNISDIKEHIERMGKIRRNADLLGDKRKYLGAMAGMVFNDHVRDFALGKGFFVIKPSGETFIITEPPGEPRAW